MGKVPAEFLTNAASSFLFVLNRRLLTAQRARPAINVTATGYPGKNMKALAMVSCSDLIDVI